MKNTLKFRKLLFITIIGLFIGCSANSSEEDPAVVDPDPIDPPPVSTVEVSTFAALQAADGLTMDSSGNLFAANYGQSKVYKVATDGSISVLIENQPGAAGMAFDSQGKLLLARYASSDIVSITAQGTVGSTIANGVAAPIAVAFDSSGNIYTNNNVNSAVTKIDSNGNKVVISHTINNNSSVTLDDNDNIYVSDYDSGRIIKIDANTSAITTFVNLPINGGVGFIIYSHGNFYATAIGEHTIYKISMEGVAERIAGIKGTAGLINGNGDVARFNKPNGIVASADGKTLYVAQAESGGAIRVITGF